MHGVGEESVQDFVGKTTRKKTIYKTKAKTKRKGSECILGRFAGECRVNLFGSG
jgi:hypothetical protein